MDLVLFDFMVVAFAGGFIYVTWVVSEWVWFKPKRIEKYLRKQGLKGNSYRLLFGDMKEHTRLLKEVLSKPILLSNDISHRLFPIYHEVVKTHGANSFVWFGARPGINIANPELIKEVLAKNFVFQKPKLDPLIKLLIPGLTDHDGEKWAKHRKIINPAFHMEKLKLMVPEIFMSCMEMLTKWNDIVPVGGVEMDVWPYLQALTSDAISRTAFGSNYKEGKKIFHLQKEQSQLVIESVNSVYIPGWRFLPTKKNRRMNVIYNEVNISLMDIINKRLEVMETGENGKKDLLGILLESNIKEIKQSGNDKTVGMTIDEVIEECKLFYFAGQETTSALLVWTMVLLSWHQDWQKRAKDEVLRVFGMDPPNFDALNHLKVVTMILYEVLRLYPPTVGMTRTVHEETKLGEMSIPAGSVLFLPTMLLHHDTEIWGEDAKEFNPERFSNGVSTATKNQLVFIPFSWGPRVCIGQNFAMLEAKMALVMLLQRFSFELSPSYTHAPFSVMTVQPQHGAHLIVHKC